VTRSSLAVQWRFAVLFSCVVVAAGCQHKPAGELAPVESNVKNIAIFYGRFMSQNRGRTPPDKEALKKFIASHPVAELAALKITDVEQLFVSPRDQQPYVVRYGAKLPPPGPSGSPVIAYEKDGDGGRRYVAFANAGVEELDDARFKELVPQP
jgi:hypothetical protein